MTPSVINSAISIDVSEVIRIIVYKWDDSICPYQESEVEI